MVNLETDKITNILKIRFSFFFIILTICINFFSCSQEKNYNAQLKGNTMGTYYIIDIINVPKKLKIKKTYLVLEPKTNLFISIIPNINETEIALIR